jgi:hypothetical protein
VSAGVRATRVPVWAAEANCHLTPAAWLAAQAIQLTWRTVKQLLAEGEESVVDRALVLFTDSGRLVSDLVTACLNLPLCSFATPETWSGMCLELSYPPQRTVSGCRLLVACFAKIMSGCGFA